MDANYKAISTKEVPQAQKHLNATQRQQLQQHLSNFSTLFDGRLGHYPHSTIHLEVQPNAVLVHSKAYSVPKTEEDVFKKELKHLVDIGVLRPCGPTEWAAPTFIIPKKDGRVRWISDFRELNKVLKRKCIRYL